MEISTVVVAKAGLEVVFHSDDGDQHGGGHAELQNACGTSDPFQSKDGDQQEDRGDDVEEHPDEGRQSGDVLREPSDES